ncbi:MAG TPA: c-type cytochrome [Rhizomicrobium sp.]|nr:c-type cytochrome [Rhizomicrobium sp.]
MRKTVLALMVMAASPAFAQDVPKGDAANGRKLYLADGCYQCHGRVGQGGLMTGVAPVLAQTKMPFAAFTRQLRNPINDMPPYPQNLLSEQAVADIYAFLQGLPGRRPVKDIPILNNNY